MTATILALLLVASAGVPDTLVVCPRDYRAALEPWLAHREAQGRHIRVIDAPATAAALRGAVRETAALGGLRYVVLVGDAEPDERADASRADLVPTHYSQAVVNVAFGSEKEIATDNWFADLDDDRVPDVAIGRLTADSPAELAAMVRKILDYERSNDFGSWRRQIHLVAGLGGFGPLADSVLEASVKSLIGHALPSEYCTTMTYGSWQSPYCPDPRLFRRVAIERLDQGSLFWVYIGHGWQRGLDQVRVPGAEYPILTSTDARKLACPQAAPVACFLACYSGAFDQPRDCLAEVLLANPRGPVAVLSSSRVAMPYGMSVLGLELMRAAFAEHAETLGDALLAAKRATAESTDVGRDRQLLDAAARLLSPTREQLAAERAEHLDLFNLLGDPLLRLPYPRRIEVEVRPTAVAGGSLVVSGSTPVAGRLTVELAVRRDRLTFVPPARAAFDARALTGYMDVYARANEHRWSASEQDQPAGAFRAQLRVPIEARGACHVRAFIEGRDACAAGAADVAIEPPTPTRQQ